MNPRIRFPKNDFLKSTLEFDSDFSAMECDTDSSNGWLNPY